MSVCTAAKDVPMRPASSETDLFMSVSRVEPDQITVRIVEDDGREQTIVTTKARARRIIGSLSVVLGIKMVPQIAKLVAETPLPRARATAKKRRGKR